MPDHSNYEKLIRAIDALSKNSTSRNEIANALGVSITAARNIADLLLSHAIAGEYQKKDGNTGRNTGILYLKNEPIFAIADILSDKITTYIFGYGIRIIECFDHRIGDLLFLDDSYTSYFRNLICRYPKLKSICIVSDGYPSNGGFLGTGIDGLDGLDLLGIAREHLGNVHVMFENKAHMIPDNTDTLCAVIHESGEKLHTTVLYKGEIISCKSADRCELGEMDSHNGRTYNSRLRYAHTADEYIACVSDYIDTILSVVDIKAVYFSSGRYSDSGLILRRVAEKLILDHGYTPLSIPHLIALTADSFPASEIFRSHIRNSHIKTLL